MIFSLLGEKNFWNGLQLYVRSFQFSSAVSSDLFSCFDQVSQSNLELIMNDWVQYSSHPILVIQSSIKNKNQYLFQITQIFDTKLKNSKAKLKIDNQNLCCCIQIFILTEANYIKIRFHYR